MDTNASDIHELQREISFDKDRIGTLLVSQHPFLWFRDSSMKTLVYSSGLLSPSPPIFQFTSKSNAFYFPIAIFILLENCPDNDS